MKKLVRGYEEERRSSSKLIKKSRRGRPEELPRDNAITHRSQIIM